MHEKLPAPKPVASGELTAEEYARGEKYPDYIIPLRARPKTAEQQALYAELSDAARSLSKFLFDAHPHPYRLSEDALIDIVDRMQVEFYSLALRARPLADSHRNFNVGAVLVGIRYPEDPGANPWVVLFDANTRQRTAEPIRKHCAELHLCDRIDPDLPEAGLAEEKVDKAVAVYVAGEPKIDDDSRKAQVAICCCKLCRDRLWTMTLKKKRKEPIMSPKMPIFTINPLNPILKKMWPISAMHDFHNEVPPGTEETE